MTNYLGKRHMRMASIDTEDVPRDPKPHTAGAGDLDDENEHKDVTVDISSTETAEAANNDDDEEEEDLGVLGKVLEVLSTPLNIMFKYTIPDCTKERWIEWYIMTFVMSIAWIGATSYVMVLFAEKAGNLIGISPIIMGVTVLAIGTSVPDALGSIFVARAGNAGMAVSNAIGSNVFDILVGLGFPWLIASIVFGPVEVCTASLTIPIIILLITVVIVTVVMMIAKWRLTRFVGASLMLTYFGFVVWNVVDNNAGCEA